MAGASHRQIFLSRSDVQSKNGEHALGLRPADHLPLRAATRSCGTAGGPVHAAHQRAARAGRPHRRGEGDHVLEVGYGPGGLVRVLAKGPSARICGVDPSPDMRDLAGRRHRADRRVDLRIGAADAIGFGDGVFDRVVSVNNVALWPDLGAGLKEFRRVLRPGGRVVIAWHGGSAPGRIARKLTLPEDKLAMIAAALGEHFADVTRHELTTLTVFTGMSV
ncbi:class I SAM-dependent methyltransferase [Nonomuraea recticatena]|uniref:class I SAM-dependent methyltransferase n=1 Tax=Nonomuraea recticatena TaxID=46178 RepID=UPI00360E26AA